MVSTQLGAPKPGMWPVPKAWPEVEVGSFLDCSPFPFGGW